MTLQGKVPQSDAQATCAAAKAAIAATPIGMLVIDQAGRVVFANRPFLALANPSRTRTPLPIASPAFPQAPAQDPAPIPASALPPEPAQTPSQVPSQAPSPAPSPALPQTSTHALDPAPVQAPPRTLADFEAAIELPTAPGEVPLGDGGRLVWSEVPGGGWVGTLVKDPAGAPPAPTATDALTGLGGRQSLAERFEAMQSRGYVHALYIDLDRFKQVNDTLGHDAGDRLLQAAARRMRSVFRDCDALARIGGDEFVALLGAGVPEKEVERVAERVIEKLGRPFLINGMQVLIGASVGLARSGGDDFEDLLRRADLGLYESKRRGRNCATWYAPAMSLAVEKRRDLEQALRRALVLDEFVVFYQPQFSFGENAITGFEALLRWQRPEGLLRPSEFIPVAEETGMMARIGGFVLDAACMEASQWPQNFTVAVNVSPLQFMDDGFVATIEDCLSRWGLPPERLELELTESVLLKEVGVVDARMRALREIGVGLSLDDFGTGYASLSYLRKFPFNKIKIDQSFVREPLADERARKIAGAVAGLGIELGINVIAEGVETPEQLERLRSDGVGAVQGFLLSEPIPADRVDSFIRHWDRDRSTEEDTHNARPL